MPRVPTYDNFQAMPSAAGPTYASNDPGPGAGAIASRQLSEAGAAASGAGEIAGRIAVSMQEQVNQTRVNDAVNQARRAALELAYHPQSGYLNLKGDAALTRPDGQSLQQEYGQKLQESLDTIGGTLGNEAQRRAFKANATDLLTRFSGEVEQHMLTEYRAHELSTQDGTIALASDEAKRYWQDPEKMAPALLAAQAAVVNKGKVMGWAASQTDAALLATTSKVHTDVILSALANGNPTYAAGYLKSRSGQMTADDILRVQGHVNQQMWEGQAQQAVQSTTNRAMPQFAPTDFDRLVQITLQSESAGRRYGADGKLLTSPAGAQGEMQVMPATAANPGLGVKPAQAGPDGKIPPDELARVGRDYLQALMQRYSDPAKAWAAYNAGPGRLDKALAEAEKDAKSGAFRGPVPADLWLQKMPPETQTYVAKNMKALGNAGGVAPRPTELDFVSQALATLPPNSPPTLVQITRERAVQQYGLIAKSMAETADSTLAVAQRWLATNPGRTVDQLPPEIVNPLRQFAPGKIDDLVRYSVAINKREVQTDWGVYNALAAHPVLLQRMSDADFENLRGKLSDEDFRHFSNERGGLLNKQGGANDPGNASSAALTEAVNENLRALKIDPTPKDDGGEDAARVGMVRKFVTDDVLRAQALVGRKFTEAEVRQHVGTLFAQRGVLSRWYGGADPAQLLTMRAGDIPGDVRKALREDFAKQGVASPTDAQLLGAYWTLKTRLPKKVAGVGGAW